MHTLWPTCTTILNVPTFICACSFKGEVNNNSVGIVQLNESFQEFTNFRNWASQVVRDVAFGDTEKWISRKMKHGRMWSIIERIYMFKRNYLGVCNTFIYFGNWLFLPHNFFTISCFCHLFMSRYFSSDVRLTYLQCEAGQCTTCT